jgi:dimethylaniline monooxygenase (N-oxide forming)
LPQYVEYLQSYVDRFELAPFIKLGCPVTSITPLEKSQWKHRVKYVDRKNDKKRLSFDCSHVAVCTGRTAVPYTTHLLILPGLHVEPNVPEIPGIEQLQGTAFHSSQYKGRAQLMGQDVLIMGCGETGMGMSELLLVSFRANITRCCL